MFPVHTCIARKYVHYASVVKTCTFAVYCEETRILGVRCDQICVLGVSCEHTRVLTVTLCVRLRALLCKQLCVLVCT